jgi:16S rRNA (guanine527-N7)-methyltransferase
MTNTLFESVSRETIDRLELYKSLVEKWNHGSFLIQKNTIVNFWDRHVLDSIQLFNHLTIKEAYCDVGSGAGLPGIPLCIMGIEKIDLIEINLKKTIFLKEVIRQLSLKATVVNEDITHVHKTYDTILSRAMTSLLNLLKMTSCVSRETTQYYFWKGETWEKEIEEARKEFSFKYEIIPSITHTKSCILRITNLQKI